jgi:hypothetical protein
LFTLPSDHGQILASLKESQMHVKLIGTAVNEGAARLGCDMGPAAYRAAKLPGMLTELGHQVSDLGDVVRAAAGAVPHSNSSLKNLGETIAWTEALAKAAYEASADGMPIFMGGDHSLQPEPLQVSLAAPMRMASRFLCSGLTRIPISIPSTPLRAAIFTARRLRILPVRQVSKVIFRRSP